MRTLKRCAIVGLVLCAFVQAAAWAFPTAAEADSLARNALARQQYADVVKVYANQNPEDLSALSFYRLAIAYQKLGDGASASAALAKALALNPNGTFASSPDRLSKLRSDIGKTADGDKPAVAPVAPPLAEPVSVLAPEAVAGPSELAQKSISVIEPIVEPTPGVDPVVTPPALESVLLSQEVRAIVADPIISPVSDTVLDPKTLLPDRTQIITAFFLVGAFGILVIFYESALKRRDAELRTAADKFATLQDRLDFVEEELFRAEASARTLLSLKPVSDVGDLVALRNEVTKVRELIERAGTSDSLLSKALEKLEPLVAMEIGRNHFRLNRDPSVLVQADQLMLTTVMHLEHAPLSLDGANAEDVMRYYRGGGDRFSQILDLATPEKKVA